MRRWVAVAALGAAFLTQLAWAQRRGGVVGGFGGHAGFTARGPMMMNHSFGVANPQRSVHFSTGFRRPGSAPLFFRHHGRFLPSSPYAGYYSYPYYGSPWYYGDDPYSADSYQSYPPSDDSGAYFGSNREQAEINRLENEVGRLREERDERSQARPKTEVPPTELVFRDNRSEQVQNYAIVGQTFWVFDAQRARKIPLSELNIPATKKANDDRGVDFQLPE